MEDIETHELGDASSSGTNDNDEATQDDVVENWNKRLKRHNHFRDTSLDLKPATSLWHLMFDSVLKNRPKTAESPKDKENSSNFEVVQTKQNTKSLSKDAKTYELEKFEKNLLIIFYQESIDTYEPRLGINQDVHLLTESFSKFGFEVQKHKDLTKDKIIEQLETFKNTDFTEYGCVGIVVLTHGSSNGALRAQDLVYDETEIIKYFRGYDKPTLITKPKFLIVQTSKGKKIAPETRQESANLRKDLDEEKEPYTLPVMADMLVVHSSYEGETFTNDVVEGSWFIRKLCSKIDELSSTHDFESIITEVKLDVAADRGWGYDNRTFDEGDVYKQVPTVTSTLIRKLYLKKFENKTPSVTFLDLPSPVASANTVLDTAGTPMKFQLGPCTCFLDHFNYIKDCLKYYLEANSSDKNARSLLNICEKFEDENHFNAAKQTTAEAICSLLAERASSWDYFKYLYLYKHGEK